MKSAADIEGGALEDVNEARQSIASGLRRKQRRLCDPVVSV